jgi:hypothetical protein
MCESYCTRLRTSEILAKRARSCCLIASRLPDHNTQLPPRFAHHLRHVLARLKASLSPHHSSTRYTNTHRAAYIELARKHGTTHAQAVHHQGDQHGKARTRRRASATHRACVCLLQIACGAPEDCGGIRTPIFLPLIHSFVD